MSAKIISIGATESYDHEVRVAAERLRDGAIVVFPTETVYGVGANAANPGAMARLRAAKGRDDGKPFTIHLGRRSDASRYVPNPNALARRFARRAWPGPLTLICEAPAPEQTPIAMDCPAGQLGEIFSDRRVGLRCPDHAVAGLLLRECGAPISASSANAAGAPPPRSVAEALAQLGDAVDLALDAGPTPRGVASSIVELSGDQWQLRRVGLLEERVLERMARTEILMVCTGNSCRSPLAEHIYRRTLAASMGISESELARQGFGVISAGTSAYAGGAISSGSLEELKNRGIDAAEHRARALTVELIQRAEKIYAMAERHRDAILSLAPGAAGRVELLDPGREIDDPIGAGGEAYRACAAQIERAVALRVEELMDEDRGW